MINKPNCAECKHLYYCDHISILCPLQKVSEHFFEEDYYEDYDEWLLNVVYKETAGYWEE